MNSKQSDNLVKKYLNAQSTLDEEEQLLQNENQHSELAEWFTYVNQNKVKAPANLKDSVWGAIQTRKRKKRRRFISLMGIAASVMLITGFFIYDAASQRSEYEKKEALLNEAKSMYAEDRQDENILFEDEMVIIYLADNNL